MRAAAVLLLALALHGAPASAEFAAVEASLGQDSAWVDSKITLDGPFTVESWVRLAPGIGNEDGLLGVGGGVTVAVAVALGVDVALANWRGVFAPPGRDRRWPAPATEDRMNRRSGARPERSGGPRPVARRGLPPDPADDRGGPRLNLGASPERARAVRAARRHQRPRGRRSGRRHRREPRLRRLCCRQRSCHGFLEEGGHVRAIARELQALLFDRV